MNKKDKRTGADPIFICNCGGTYEHQYPHDSALIHNPLICNKCKVNEKKDDDK